MDVRNVLYIIVGAIIALDLIGNCCIPPAYGHGCGWFFVPNILVSAIAIYSFVKYIKSHKND